MKLAKSNPRLSPKALMARTATATATVTTAAGAISTSVSVGSLSGGSGDGDGGGGGGGLLAASSLNTLTDSERGVRIPFFEYAGNK